MNNIYNDEYLSMNKNNHHKIVLKKETTEYCGLSPCSLQSLKANPGHIVAGRTTPTPREW